jgi:hypothetical protein
MIRRLVASLQPVWNLWCLHYNRAALRQIDPLHADVPRLVLRVHELESQRSAT